MLGLVVRLTGESSRQKDCQEGDEGKEGILVDYLSEVSNRLGTLYILYRRGGIPKETINVELGLSRISARWRDCPELRRCLGTRVTTELVRMGLRKVPEWKGVLKVLDTRR